MSTICSSDLKSPEALCEWLNDGTAPSDLKTETIRPWAQTFRIEGELQDRFLKVLPDVQTAAVPAMPLLSMLFPEVVPTVQAVDAARGLVLLEHHGGVAFERSASVEQQQAILVTYAKLQARAARQDELLGLLPRAVWEEFVPNLLKFLDPACEAELSTGPARGKNFLDENRCRYYFELFETRATVLADLIAQAKQLPTTINHCDLRSANAAMRQNGDVMIYDWDEAVAGPAGMSLHNFFSGCSTPCEMLLSPTSTLLPERANARTLLGSYLSTLTAHGYGDAARLKDGLPGAICAGVIQYVLSYGKFLPPDEEYAEDVGEIIRRRLNDLLVLADILHATSRDTTFAVTADYEKRERPDHACRVLARYVEQNPADCAAVTKLATLLDHKDNRETAPGIFERLLNAHPENGAIQRIYGLHRFEELDFDAAIYHLTQAVQLGETDDVVAVALDEATEFRDVCRNARQSGRLPSVRVSAEEQVQGKMKPVRRRLAVKLFREYGTLLIENAFSDALVNEMRREYMDRYQRYFVNERHSDALKVGNKRFMVTVDVEGAYHSPMVYANPHVASVIQDVLGGSGNMILGGFVSVCSLPGAESMRIHKDHPALFPELDDPDKCPSMAVTAIVPLLGFNHELGTTRVWKKSHQVSSEVADEMEFQDPSAPPGTVLLMDYRLTHQGRANKSDQVRPILTMIYHRPWFRDIVNYGIQDPILMSDEAFERIPEEHRHLFAWTRPHHGQQNSSPKM